MIDFRFDFRYDGEKEPALKNTGGTIESGKCIVLCGGSGCGKSTLLRCLNHLVPEFFEGELKGFYHIGGKDTDELSIGEVGELAASVFQDPRSQFFTINSSTEVAFGLENHGISRDAMRRRVDEAFAAFGLERLRDRNVYELSSGERQMISILSAWAMDTDILLLDEPTANLDFTAIRQLRDMLMTLKKQGKTMILSEHRLYYLQGIADEFWLVSDGQLQKRYTAEEFAALPEETYAQMPLRTQDLGKVKLSSHLDVTSQPGTASAVLNVDDLHFTYRKRSDELLNGISLQASCGEIVGLIGSNGSGKTTLGKLICGLVRPAAGSITFDGWRMKPKELHQNALFVMQETEFQFFTNSVMKELMYGHRAEPELEAKAERLLKKFGMWECRDRHPFCLSGGQMQKLSLMVAYLSAKRIVVLDEPTAGLDAESLRSCAELIREMRAEKLVFVISHDIELIAQICTRCLCISSGKVEREFSLTGDAQLRDLVSYMEQGFHMQSGTQPLRPAAAKGRAGRLHPAVKLLFCIVTMIVVSLSSNTLMFSVYAALVVMMIIDRWYAVAAAGGGLIAMLLGLNVLLDNTAVSFALVFFPRILAVGLSMYTMIGRNEAARTLAALRELHVPEKLIMICAVIFRFFPVLSGDMKLMRQSVQTRGVFTSLGQKLRSLPEYLEILTVPMALRVIRIAETLSASAETRGIDLKIKRSSYVSLRYGVWDVVSFIMLAAAVAAGAVI